MSSIKVQQSNAWTIAVLAIIAIAPIISNLATLIGAALFVVWLFKYREFPIDYRSAVGRLSLVFIGYFFIILFVTLANEHSVRALQSLGSSSQFLYLALLLPFLSTKMRGVSFSTIGCLATSITLMAFVLAIVEYQFLLNFDSGFVVETSERIRPKWIGLFLGDRVALLTGNPNTLATILFPLAFLSVVGWQYKSLVWKVLAVIAMISGLLTTGILAETRITIVAAPILSVIIWFYLFHVERSFAYFLAALFLMIVMVAAYRWDVVSEFTWIRRMTALLLELSNDSEVFYDNSVAARWVMFKSTWYAFLDSPLIGHGAHNKYEAIRAYFQGTILQGSNFRTTHNILVTHAAVGGLLGISSVLMVIMSPLYNVWRIKSNLWQIDNILIALILSTSLITLGMSETMFFNDAKNTFYIIIFFLAAQLNDCKQPKLAS